MWTEGVQGFDTLPYATAGDIFFGEKRYLNKDHDMSW